MTRGLGHIDVVLYLLYESSHSLICNLSLVPLVCIQIFNVSSTSNNFQSPIHPLYYSGHLNLLHTFLLPYSSAFDVTNWILTSSHALTALLQQPLLISFLITRALLINLIVTCQVSHHGTTRRRCNSSRGIVSPNQ